MCTTPVHRVVPVCTALYCSSHKFSCCLILFSCPLQSSLCVCVCVHLYVVVENRVAPTHLHPLDAHTSLARSLSSLVFHNLQQLTHKHPGWNHPSAFSFSLCSLLCAVCVCTCACRHIHTYTHESSTIHSSTAEEEEEEERKKERRTVTT